MQWLILGPEISVALIRHEHKIHLPAELGLPAESPATDILKAANAKQWDIITSDVKLAMTPFENGQSFRRCVVFLQLTGGAEEMSDAVDRLFARFKRLKQGRLYTVTAHGVKVRQLPTGR